MAVHFLGPRTSYRAMPTLTQTSTVALRVNKKMVQGCSHISGGSLNKTKTLLCKPPLNSPMSLALSASRFNCAGVLSVAWYHSLRGSLYVEVALVCTMDIIIFLARTMLHCDAIGQMAQTLCPSTDTQGFHCCLINRFHCVTSEISVSITL